MLNEAFDWREWFVPPVVISAVFIAWFLGYVIYQYL